MVVSVLMCSDNVCTKTLGRCLVPGVFLFVFITSRCASCVLRILKRGESVNPIRLSWYTAVNFDATSGDANMSKL